MKDLSLDSSCLAFKAGFYVHLSGTATRRQLSWRGWRIRAWSRFLFGPETLRMQDGDDGLTAWIASLPASPASPGAQLESAKAKVTKDGCGPEFFESFRKRNRGFASLKTCRDLFLEEGSNPSLLTLPRSGSMRNGLLFERPTWAPATNGNGCSSWLGVTTSDARGHGYTRDRGDPNSERPSLAGLSALWATPVAGMGEKGAEDPATKTARQKENGGGTSDLLIQAQNWPTPDAYGHSGSNTSLSPNAAKRPALAKASSSWPTPMVSDDGDKVTPAAHQESLTMAAREWPSPATRDYRSPNLEPYAERGGGKKGEQLPNFVKHFSPQVLKIQHGEKSSPNARGSRRRLNPSFVAWLMGNPFWWTRAEPISFARAEMALWRSALRSRLLFLLKGE